MDDHTLVRKGETTEGVLQDLTATQLKFLSFYLFCKDKSEAAKLAGIAAGTVYNWGDKIDKAKIILSMDSVTAVMELRKKYVLKALNVMVEHLDSGLPWLQHHAAKGILEAVLGKAAENKNINLKTESMIDLDSMSDEELNQLENILEKHTNSETSSDQSG